MDFTLTGLCERIQPQYYEKNKTCDHNSLHTNHMFINIQFERDLVFFRICRKVN